MTDTQTIQAMADRIRLRVLEHVLQNNGGYMSQACSAAEQFAVLYSGAVRLAPLDVPARPEPFDRVPGPGFAGTSGEAFHGIPGPDLDRLIISPAHYALVVYTALIEAGRLDPAALELFNADGSTVEMIGAEHSPGFASTTGSLSQALSQAGGIALARRLKGEIGRTFVYMSDGEFQEGQTWEAVQALAFHRLDTVTVLADVNGAQCDGPMDQVMSIEPLADRLLAFGASVDVVDAHDVQALQAGLARRTGQPHFVLAMSDPTHGLPLLEERRPVLHYLRLTGPEEKSRYAAAYVSMQEQS